MNRLELCRALAQDAGRLAHTGFGTSGMSMKGRHDVLTEMVKLEPVGESAHVPSPS